MRYLTLNYCIFKDVAVKILMEQEFHAERFKEFLREVCGGKFCSKFKVKDITNCSLSIFVFIWSKVSPVFLSGYNNETPAASKYCAFYGCSYKAPELVHCHRISIKVCDPLLQPP